MTDDVCFLSYLFALSNFFTINMYFLHKENKIILQKKRNSVNEVSKVAKVFVTNHLRTLSKSVEIDE